MHNVELKSTTVQVSNSNWPSFDRTAIQSQFNTSHVPLILQISECSDIIVAHQAEQATYYLLLMIFINKREQCYYFFSFQFLNQY